MITEQKIADLHELVRLFQERDKLKPIASDAGNKAVYAFRNNDRINTDKYEKEYSDAAKNISICEQRIETLLTKHDLKI